jgi:hypothetical protein
MSSRSAALGRTGHSFDRHRHAQATAFVLGCPNLRVLEQYEPRKTAPGDQCYVLRPDILTGSTSFFQMLALRPGKL